jgi:NADPH:quinone reductase-like Zn-dependent oxidoreductase
LGGAESEQQPNILEVLINICTVRGIYVGSRAQFEDMNRAIEANNIHPVVDKKQFQLTELKEAVQYMVDQKHFGKICIKIG